MRLTTQERFHLSTRYGLGKIMPRRNTYPIIYRRIMLAIARPFVLSALRSPKFKTFVIDLLQKLVEQSDNELDDKALEIVKKGLGV